MDTVTRKSLLYRTGIGGTGAYAATHVVGCSHGCRFPCYAFLMMQRFGKVASYEEWCQPRIASLRNHRERVSHCITRNHSEMVCSVTALRERSWLVFPRS